MRPPRLPIRGRRVAYATLPLLLCVAAVLSVPTGASPVGPLARPGAGVAVQTFANSTGVVTAAATDGTALVAVALSAGGQELVLVNLSANTSTVVQKPLAGTGTAPGEIAAAGGHYVVETSCVFCTKSRFEAVSPLGAVTSVNLPVGRISSWRLVYGNASSVFLDYSSFGGADYFVALNATTFGVAQNFTPALPLHSSVLAAVTAGGRLYLAGDEVVNGSQVPLFGYFGPSRTTFVRISSGAASPNLALLGTFDSLAKVGKTIYVGGSVSTASSGSVQGLLYKFTQRHALFQNVSSLLARSADGVLGLARWGPSLEIAAAGWHVGPSGTLSVTGDGLYLLHAHPARLLNRTARWGTGFVPGAWSGTSASQGPFLLVTDGYFGTGGTSSARAAGQWVTLHR